MQTDGNAQEGRVTALLSLCRLCGLGASLGLCFYMLISQVEQLLMWLALLPPSGALFRGFPGGSASKESACNAGDPS